MHKLAKGSLSQTDHVLIRTPQAAWSYDNLINLISEDLTKTLAGNKLTIHSSNPGLIASALIHFEGITEQVFLASASLKHEVFDELYNKSNSVIRIFEDSSEITLEKTESIQHTTAKDMHTKWILATSGTTSTPKLVPHNLESLTLSTKSNAQNDFRWGLLYDPCRFAGMQVLLQALTSQALLVCPDLNQDILEQIAFLQEHNVNALSATPTMWRKILMLPSEKRQLNLRQITLGGEIADDKVIKSLRAEYPEARIVHVYASTEAGVGFSVSDGQAGFPEKYLSTSLNGIQLKVHDGQLLIKNSMMPEKYIGASQNYSDDQGYIETGDCLEFRNGRYYFLGRSNGVINVGGNKIYPENVENILMSHPLVKMCKISAKKNPITGSIVIASIVPETTNMTTKELKKTIQQWCSSNLEPYAVPALIKFEESFTTNPSGKLIRH